MDHLVLFSPVDCVPWELDQAAIFNHQPAGGRLAYAYRILLDRPVSTRYAPVACRNRKGWGMPPSEARVFDRVSLDRNVSPSVRLPRLGKNMRAN